MELTFACPNCGTINRIAPVESASSASCRDCGERHELYHEAFDASGLRACPWCATEDIYVQKDFPQALGLLIVVIGFAISTVFWFYEMPLWTYAILMASALVDMFLYYRVPNVSICYRCLSQFRGDGSNASGRFRHFDLVVGERYRQERLRVEELRKRQATADSPPQS